MIVQSRNTQPFIHLGFGKQELTVNKDQEVTIWQDIIYNTDFYNFYYSKKSSSLISESINKLVIKYTTNGVKTVKITINDGKEVNTESNTLIITVI